MADIPAVAGFRTRILLNVPISEGSTIISWMGIAQITDIPNLPDSPPEFAEWQTYSGTGATSIKPTGRRPEVAEFSITVKYMPKTIYIHKLLRDKYDANEIIHWRIIKSDGSGKEGMAYISSFSETTPIDNVNEATITFKIDGAHFELS